MLKERIKYSEELPVKINIVEVENYFLHYHTDIEIIFVLEGSIVFENGRKPKKVLNAGEIQIINSREMHGFSSNTKNIVMIVQLDCVYFSRQYSYLENSFFVQDNNIEGIEMLKSLLCKLYMQVFYENAGYKNKAIETAHNIISCLKSEFGSFIVEQGLFINNNADIKRKKDKERINRIISYIYDNYYRKIKISEIAENEHLSVYYLSHLIKAATGLSFQDLLSFVRVEESEKLLLSTNDTMSMISNNVGFSATRYYVKWFEAWFGMTPKEYRRLYANGNKRLKSFRAIEKKEAEQAVKGHIKGSYGEYDDNKKCDFGTLEFQLNNKGLRCNRNVEPLKKKLIKSEYKKFIEMFNILNSLGEKVIAAGENYILTSPDFENIKRISILIYNFCDRKINGVQVNNIVSQYIETGNSINSINWLINLTGIKGDFNITRYKLKREAFLEKHKSNDLIENQRNILQKKWRALPDISFDKVYTAETLSISVILAGMSAELILVDKIEQERE